MNGNYRTGSLDLKWKILESDKLDAIPEFSAYLIPGNFGWVLAPVPAMLDKQ
jgi:hypothetical protein